MKGTLTRRPDPAPPKGPNYNEMERAEELRNALARSVAIAERFQLERATLPIEEARELLQLMSDSLETARRIKASR